MGAVWSNEQEMWDLFYLSNSGSTFSTVERIELKDDSIIYWPVRY